MRFQLGLWGWTIAGLLSVVQAQTATLGLANGFLTLDSPSFAIQLVKDSQTLYSLKPKGGASTFDFIPQDMMTLRQYNGNYHLGDITFRARTVGSTTWVSGDSAANRKPVTALTVSGSTLAAANLGPTLPGSLLNITRRWVIQNNQLQLLFDVTNSQTTAVEIGSLGSPLEFNNIFTGRTAADTNEKCSLFDPYIGQDAGYVQVTPLLGTLPPLVVTPVGKSPLEGWRFLPESTSSNPYYQSQTFEGLYEWQFHTSAYASNEWKAVTPWNVATSVTLQPGQTRTYGLQFNLASSIKGIESTLQTQKRPVAVGLPGYILPLDQTGKLFLNYPSAVQSISVTPAGALVWATNSDAKTAGWVGYTLTPKTWGRSRLSITYADGTLQTIHYYVTNGATQTISNLGSFLTNQQWFNDTSDPFHRAPSVITYDRELNAPVKDNSRVYIAGLEDEAGAGSWLAAIFKQYAQPNAAEVTKLEQFISKVLWGVIQNSDFTVKKSVYFHEPAKVPTYTYPSISWGGLSWNQAAAFAIDRGYDYIHVIGAYWSMYRVARNYPGLTTVNTWQWYINQAYQTTLALTGGRVGYTNVGLMEETVIYTLLQDLKREGMTANATTLESRMKSRATPWSTQKYPFGSEMAWDSTGQEGVYAWCKYFGFNTTVTNTINSILAFQPTIPHWGYNGNARRYWDFNYGGKITRYERQIHHYGSGLNALPLHSEFQASTNDYYLLRVAYGGSMGSMSNIDQAGFASAAFHSFPDTLKWDAFSGDYGPNFVGHTQGIATYVINHPDFGYQAFGGNILSTSPTVTVQPRDTLRRRVYFAPIGTRLTLDAGAFSQFVWDPTAKTIQVTITPTADGAISAAAAPVGRLVVEQPAHPSGVGTVKPTTSLSTDAGAFVVPFTSGVGVVTLTYA